MVLVVSMKAVVAITGVLYCERASDAPISHRETLAVTLYATDLPMKRMVSGEFFLIRYGTSITTLQLSSFS